MLPYYKKYSIITCVIAVLPSLIVSTIYPMITGQIMAASIGGLIALFLIFFGSLYFGFLIMERKAEQDTEKLLALYNTDCDPELFVDKGSELAGNIAFPCKETGAWYLGYYGQALMDVKDIDRAKGIAAGLESSISAAKKPSEKVGILVNLLPLAEKLFDRETCERLIADGLQFVAGDISGAAAVRRDFLNGQKKLLDARESLDPDQAIKLYRSIMTSNNYPMRVRVESAWSLANVYFKTANLQDERAALDFVVKNGNKLALVSQAQKRISSLG